MDLFNSTFYGESSILYDQYSVDPGLQAVNNFETIMKLFPKEHPAGIHGIMLMCNNDLQKAVDMLLYVTQYRKLTEYKKGIKLCQNCSNVVDSDMDLLEDCLKNISARSDADEEIEDGKKDVDYATPMKIIKLEPITDAPKKKGKGKTYIIPSSTTLKNIFQDNNSQFVKIVMA